MALQRNNDPRIRHVGTLRIGNERVPRYSPLELNFSSHRLERGDKLLDAEHALEAIKSEDIEDRIFALLSIENLDPIKDDLLDLISKVSLKDASPTVRIIALDVLVNIDARSKEATKSLKLYLQSSNPRDRVNAAVFLLSIDEADITPARN